jgi:hypothetical protein
MSEQDGRVDEEQESGRETDVSSSGVEVEGYETSNNPREEQDARMEADSADDLDDNLLEQIEKDREERLDPDNRPDNVEVDNTQRTFNPETAQFEDSDIDQDPSLGQGESDEDVSGDDDGDHDGDDGGDATKDETDTDRDPADADEKVVGRHKA